MSEISDQKYDLRNSMIEIILRGEDTRHSCTEERRLCIQHLVIEIGQGDPITVTRARRLSPNRHLLGISTELADLMILFVVFVYSQSPAFGVPLSRTLWPPRNPKALNR